jgi:uroporphyrinogen-III synthase
MVARQFPQAQVAVPATQSGAALAAIVAIRPGESVLVPASNIANDDLRSALIARGVEVTVVEAYRTLVGFGGADLPRLLVRGEVDAVTFTSPSTVKGFVARLNKEFGRKPALDGVVVACIGATTLVEAREQGFAHAIAANPQSLEGLVSALSTAFSISRQGAQR